MMDMSGTPCKRMTHDHGRRLDANGAAVKIISPAHNAVLDRDTVIVRVETTNWPLGEEASTGICTSTARNRACRRAMRPALQARDLQPGENIIEVVLSNELHQELDATDKITVRYEAPAGRANSR